ncbi:TRAP transporter small permease subunit [Loktanella agnita]|uniref:TRAP transporter small permease subunit n=1 Tax=Loktanella agnita TaxID=287097 RepID=UPI00398979FD
MEEIKEIAAISDPGEIGRKNHNRADRFVILVANIAAWLFPILMLAICAQVVLRGIGMNQAWLDDLQWWLYGAAVLVGVGYAVTTNSHVRVDILYDHFPQDKKSRIDIFALGWLFLPFIILCWDVTLGYAIQSIGADEGSSSPNGLHNLWILKSFVNISFIFVGIACWAAIYRSLRTQGRSALWQQMLAALPATFFLINLTIYYCLWVIIWLTSPAGTRGRQIGRHAVFDEVEIGVYEFTYTVVAALILTPIIILTLRALDQRRQTLR